MTAISSSLILAHSPAPRHIADRGARSNCCSRTEPFFEATAKKWSCARTTPDLCNVPWEMTESFHDFGIPGYGKPPFSELPGTGRCPGVVRRRKPEPMGHLARASRKWPAASARLRGHGQSGAYSISDVIFVRNRALHSRCDPAPSATENYDGFQTGNAGIPRRTDLIEKFATRPPDAGPSQADHHARFRVRHAYSVTACRPGPRAGKAALGTMTLTTTVLEKMFTSESAARGSLGRDFRNGRGDSGRMRGGRPARHSRGRHNACR